MKIRIGFVSNSSSSSYIVGEPADSLLKRALEVTDRKYITVKEVALEMLKASGRLKTFELLKNDSKEYEYISFKSCNEPTIIFYQEDGSIAVTTCNNESSSWRIAMDAIKNKFNVETKYTGEDFCYEVRIPDFPNEMQKVFSEWEDYDTIETEDNI